MDVPRAWEAMRAAVRNLGRPGVAATAISAVDAALWDLKGKLLGVSLADLLGRARDAVPAYGSGGFTSYTIDELRGAARRLGRPGLRDGQDEGRPRPGADPDRVRAAREAIGPDVALFVDANGAYDRKQALAMADRFADEGVSWFEEPVSIGRPRGAPPAPRPGTGRRWRSPPASTATATATSSDSFEAGAVDVLQADATRCLGLTGFLRAGALAAALRRPALGPLRPEPPRRRLLRPAGRPAPGVLPRPRPDRAPALRRRPAPEGGLLRPDRSRPGLGLEFKRADAGRFAL